MEEYKGKAEVKNSSETVDFGYYDFKIKGTDNGGRIQTGVRYLCEFVRLDQFHLVLKIVGECKCLKDC